MKFFIQDEKNNSYEFTLSCEEKCGALYDLVKNASKDVGSDTNDFYLYSEDLEVKLNREYVLHKYFSKSENLLIKLKLLSMTLLHDTEPTVGDICTCEVCGNTDTDDDNDDDDDIIISRLDHLDYDVDQIHITLFEFKKEQNARWFYLAVCMAVLGILIAIR
jgi:hypothetical protein